MALLIIQLVILLIILIVGIGFYLYYLYCQHIKIVNVYESEKPIDTQKCTTFEEAVSECAAAYEKIRKLDENTLPPIDKEIRIKQNINGGWINLLNILLKRGVYTEKPDYLPSESEEDKLYRISWRRGLVCLILFPFLSLFLSSGGWFSFLLIGLYLVYLTIIPLKLPSEMRNKLIKTMIYFPWRSNTQPFGSDMYILQKDFNKALDDIHRLYYEEYLPYLRIARTIENPQSKFYGLYHPRS